MSQNFHPFEPFPTTPRFGGITTRGYACIYDPRVFEKGKCVSGELSWCNRMHGDLREALLCSIEHEATLPDDRVETERRQIWCATHEVRSYATWEGPYFFNWYQHEDDPDPVFDTQGRKTLDARSFGLLSILVPNAREWTASKLISALRDDLRDHPPAELKVEIYDPTGDQYAEADLLYKCSPRQEPPDRMRELWVLTHRYTTPSELANERAQKPVEQLRKSHRRTPRRHLKIARAA
jgi:hypothetical protein